MFVLHRVDLLIDQAPDELLDPAIDLAIEKRLRHVELDARGQLLHQVAAHFALGFVFRLVLQILAHALPQRVERVELSQVLGELVVERAVRTACGWP